MVLHFAMCSNICELNKLTKTRFIFAWLFLPTEGYASSVTGCPGVNNHVKHSPMVFDYRMQKDEVYSNSRHFMSLIL